MDELVRAQAELARALERARAGEDRELAAAVREKGEGLAHLLSGLLKLTRVHSPDNHAFDAPVAELVRVLAALNDRLGVVHLVTVEDQIYVNDVRIRAEAKGGRDLGSDLRRHNVGGLSFHAPLPDAHVRALVRALAAAPAASGPRGALARALEESGLGTVELHGVFRFRTTRQDDPEERLPDAIAARMLALVAETFDNVGAGRAANPLPLRRAVMEALDAGVASPAFWAPFRDAPPHAAHALEVAFVSILVARAAGFGAAFVQDVGIAGLLHDAGYLASGIGEDAAGLERHAVEGARVMLRQRGFHDAKVRRLRAILEHHRDAAGPAGAPSAGGAILRLAEDYSNAIRLYGARVTRADVLGGMLRAGGRYYHPALAQVLVNALGRHPPGSLLELADGRVVRVAAPPASPERWERPPVQALDPATRAPSGPLLDLADGPPVRRVVPG
jgi:hypothetical protein